MYRPEATSAPIVNYTLWPFQKEGVSKNLEFMRSGTDAKPVAGISVYPTGTGKSLIISRIVAKLGQPVLVLQPSKELLEQNYEKYTEYGGIASIYSASVGKKNASEFTFATPKSLVGKGELFRRILKVRYVIIDECHKDLPPEEYGVVTKFLSELKPIAILGLTATPVRLGESIYGPILNFITRTTPRIFTKVIDVVQIKDICKEYWKKIDYKEYDFDERLLKLNKAGTEFTDESVIEAVRANNVNNTIYMDACDLILKQGHRSGMLFLDSVDTCEKMNEYFVRQGIKSAVVSSKTAKGVRSDYVKDFKKFDLNLLLNYGTLTTGFDHKHISFLGFGRPSNSFSLIYQMGGRLVRRSDQVETGLLIDYCNNIKRHGRFEDITFEEIEGYGWGMFSGDILKSGRGLKMAPITKAEIIKKAMNDIKNKTYEYMDFGEYRGVHINDVPTDYLEEVYVLNMDNGNMSAFCSAIEKELERRI